MERHCDVGAVKRESGCVALPAGLLADFGESSADPANHRYTRRAARRLHLSTMTLPSVVSATFRKDRIAGQRGDGVGSFSEVPGDDSPKKRLRVNGAWLTAVVGFDPSDMSPMVQIFQCSKPVRE